MSESKVLALEVASLAIYADIPCRESLVPEIELGLWHIREGATIWPGNGEPITDEVRNSYLAGSVIGKLVGLILDREAAEQDPKLFNPYLTNALEVIEGLVPSDKLTEEIVETTRQILESYDSSVWEGGDEAGFFAVHNIVRNEPSLEQLWNKKVLKAGELIIKRGVVREEAVYEDEALEPMSKVDLSTVAPDFLIVKDDGTVAVPWSWNLVSILNQSEAEASMDDFPYYATWEGSNGVEMLTSLLEDLVSLHNTV